MLSSRSFLKASGRAFAASLLVGTKMTAVPQIHLDHILLGCRDLNHGIAYLETLSGYRAAIGGSHPGRGTCNALLKMGAHSYLEILAPDPQQKELAWHKDIATLSEPLLVGYAIRQDDLETHAAAFRARGISCIGPTAGFRARPDGSLLRWQTLSYQDDRNGLLPFFIDWDPRSPHPSFDAPGELTLLSFNRTGQLLEETTPPSGKHKLFHPEQPVQLRALLRGAHGEFELVSKSSPSETWSS